jgi:malonyl-CoA O-methyltransferase
VISRFSAAARMYAAEPVVQKTVARRLLGLIENQWGRRRPARRILEIGCGTGLLTRELARRFPSAAICAMDIAQPMVLRAKRLVGRRRRIHWVVADARDFRVRCPFPLVVSSSSLHWAVPLEATMANVRRLVTADGRLICAIMTDGTLKELHTARRRVAPRKVPVGRLPRRHEIRAVFRKTGFCILLEQAESLRETHRSGRDFLASIHRRGLTGGAVSLSSIPLNRRELDALVRFYDTHYTEAGGRVSATYEVLYLVARRVR